MAEHVSPDAPAAPEGPAVAEGAAARARARLRRFEADLRRRFGFAYLVLAVVAGAAVGLFIVFLGRSGSGQQGPWSAFKPTAFGLEAASQIAAQVAPRYRLAANGDQLLNIVSGAAQIQDVRISAVAIRSGFPDEALPDIPIYRTDDTIMYQLCGAGDECAIAGKPSPSRGRLLRREVLELSLFTFKYVGADSVIAFTPPMFRKQKGKLEPIRTVAFLRRDDFRPELKAPLRMTLRERAIVHADSLDGAEADTLQRVRLMQYNFQLLPDQTALLIVAPVSSS